LTIHALARHLRGTGPPDACDVASSVMPPEGSRSPIPAAHLDEVLDAAAADLSALAGGHLLITGGTGFVGKWLLEILLHANVSLGLDVHVTVLARRPEAMLRDLPHLAHRSVVFVAGDVLDPPLLSERFDAVIHGATPASAELNSVEPEKMFRISAMGTAQLMDAVAPSGAIPFLLTSSGAVYGAQPSWLPRVGENFLGGPDPLAPSAAYAEGKRAAELLVSCAGRAGRLRPRIARMFAFAGPYLPLNEHFAIGNFVRDAVAGGPVVVQGDGTAVRSYLDATEMVAWLLAILVRGEDGRAYNVGSSRAIDISTLAHLAAASVGPNISVEIRSTSSGDLRRDVYVPDTTRIEAELGVTRRVEIETSVDRMVRFYRGRR